MDDDAIVGRELGLRRSLTQRQLTMIGIGGAIGTGLFMGSGIAIGYAGPGVLVSYLIAAAIAVIVMFSLSEMAVMHPTAGSFGTYAEKYLNPCMGFLVRYTYWAAQVILIGSEAVAIGHYMNYWLPQLPIWTSALGSGAVILFVNTRSVANFGSVEYWLATIKVSAIIAFIMFGLANVLGIGAPATGFVNYTVDGGPFPHGISGIWMAVIIAVFSFSGIEMIAVSAGEAADPKRSVPRALQSMMLRLLVFYILALAIMLAVVPWTETGVSNVDQSPFVKVFASFGLGTAAGVMNFVVLSAALSAMNSSLYMSTRMMFSLARGGYAPAGLGRLSSRGVPVRATLVSGIGVLIAAGLALVSPKAFEYLVGISLFGGIFAWSTILVTHIQFRGRSDGDLRALEVRSPFSPWLQVAGLALMGGLLITMAASAEFWRMAVATGAVWLAGLSVIYFLRGRFRAG